MVINTDKIQAIPTPSIYTFQCLNFNKNDKVQKLHIIPCFFLYYYLYESYKRQLDCMPFPHTNTFTQTLTQRAVRGIPSLSLSSGSSMPSCTESALLWSAMMGNGMGLPALSGCMDITSYEVWKEEMGGGIRWNSHPVMLYFTFK